MKRKGRERVMPAADLPMTPMIDLVFLLLVFFITTVKPMDVFAHLDVKRSGNGAGQASIHPLKIGVLEDALTLDGRVIAEEELASKLKYFVGLDKDTAVVVLCSSQTRHERLVKVLDLCAGTKVANVGLVSAP